MGSRGWKAWSPHTRRAGLVGIWRTAFSGTKGHRLLSGDLLPGRLREFPHVPLQPALGSLGLGLERERCLPTRRHATQLILPNTSLPALLMPTPLVLGADSCP